MRALPFYLLLIMTFALSSLEKFLGASTPDWFLNQFKDSILNVAPLALPISFFVIAIFEGLSAAVLIFGISRGELRSRRRRVFLEHGVMLSQLVFIGLGFGQKLTHKFDAAALLFFYAALTFIGGEFARRTR